MKVLVVIDMQNDFVLPEGSLSVNGAMKIVPIVNSLRNKFYRVLFSFDWHPRDHVSFVNNHPGHNIYDVVPAGPTTQVLFPAHCIQNTPGAKLHESIQTKETDLIVQKGLNKDVDSYSCFFDVVKSSKTITHELLQSVGATELYFLGVATDYCVKFSVIDALSLGYKVYVIEDGIAGVDPSGSEAAIQEMKEKGAVFIKSADI